MIEVKEIEKFVVSYFYDKYLYENIKSKHENKSAPLFCEWFETTNKLYNDPIQIISMIDEKPDIKQAAFIELKKSGGVKWYRYLDMSNPVIQWVNENLERVEAE